MGDWYYIGHYGQLGPLTKEQMEELIEGGVIARETFVWKTGMNDWVPAERVIELTAAFTRAEPFSASPPPPPSAPPRFQSGTSAPAANLFGNPKAEPLAPAYSAPMSGYLPSSLQSDRSRALAGVLQLILPGVGRIYLGYAAVGVLQLILAMCMVGWIWSIIDGIVILTGGMRVDGYGRQLRD